MSRPLRYTLILVLFALGISLAALTGWRYARASAPVNGPIVLISIDALRADRLPVYGYTAGRTPALDALAKDGIVFERAYSHVPQTLPAHAALLTGRLPFENGVRDSVGFAVNTNERLLAEMLADRGYATAGVVSSFLLRKATGIGQGFALFDGVPEASADGEVALVRDGAESERVAEHWFDSAGTTRAFLFLHLAEPAIDAGVAVAPPLTYDARVSAADELVGRMVRYLKAHQLYDQSTIFVVADHGQGFGEHGEEGHGLLLNDDVLRVPLIVKQVGAVRAGSRVRSAVQHIDIVPTILDLAKAPIPGTLRGRSLVPLLNGDRNPDNRMLYAESLFGRYHFGWEPLTSVSDGRYRYIGGTVPELYDFETDRSSGHNLADSRPELVAQFQRALSEFASTTTIPPMDAVLPADRASLERLGYVGTASLSRPSAGAPSEPASAVVDPTIVEQYRSAVRLLAARQLNDAIEAFRALAVRQGTSADSWQHVAAVATLAEKPEVAADAYRRIVELTPSSSDGHVGLARALLSLRRFDDARAQAMQIVDDSIGDATVTGTAHELLARAALGRRNYEIARAEAAKAEAANPKRPMVAYVNGRIAVDQRKWNDALDAFESALAALRAAQEPPLADLRLYAAEALARAERLSEAEYLFLEELKDAPFNSRAVAGLTAVYKATSRNDEAKALAQH